MGEKATDSGVLDSVNHDDILIAVVGNVRVGKSTFISKAAEDDLLLTGQALEPDNKVQYTVCFNADLYIGQKIVFLDMPAFDSDSDEQVIENKLRDWLRVVISKRLSISGVLYLHRMTEPDFLSTSLRHLTLFVALCEELNQGPSAVLLVLTMQALLPRSARLQRRKEIQDRWHTVFPQGASQSTRFENSSDSAWEIVMDLTVHLKELAKHSGRFSSVVSGSHPSANTHTQSTVTGRRKLSSTMGPSTFPITQQSNKFVSSTGPQHTPSPYEHPDDSSRACNQSRILISGIAESPLKRMHIIALVGDEAQCMVDFLDVLEEKSVLRTDEGAHIFSVLSKLAKAAQVFPRRYHLPGVVCDLTYPWKQGGFGDIYKGFCGDQEVCVKVVRVYQREDNQTKLREHVKELILWAHLLHPNIIPLRGVYLSSESPPRICIVSPWVKYGDLSRYVNDFPERPRMPLLSDVISGLRYLHESKITHADLKAANVLVSNTRRAMITDFGISQSESATTTLISSGTVNWMAPELFYDDARPTKESDIWSFGCLCYEVLARKIPFSDQHGTVARLIRAFIDGNATLSRPLDDSDDRIGEKMWDLIAQCLDYCAERRPRCEDIQRSLMNMKIKDSRAQLYGKSVEERRAHPNVELDYQRLETILVRCNVASSPPYIVCPTLFDSPNTPNSFAAPLVSALSGAQLIERGDRVVNGLVTPKKGLVDVQRGGPPPEPITEPGQPKKVSSPLTKRQHALHELLSSERVYASDLALIREVHIPLALGLPITSQNSSGSSRTLSTASDSSLMLLGPPMSPEDVKLIFGNISEIAAFSDSFCQVLEEALGALDGGKGNDCIGVLFLSTVSELERLYKQYITRHPTALTHLQQLPQKPAIRNYLSYTQSIASSLSHAWDLPSLLIKPVQRLLYYPLLLTAIIDETPDNHSDKENLCEARKKVEEVVRNVNEGRRRVEVVRDVLTSEKKGPVGVTVSASVNLTKMTSLRVGGPFTKTANGPPSDEVPGEAILVERLEKELKEIEEFSRKFAKNVVEWARMTSNVVGSLRTWALGFAKVIGLSADQCSEAFDAFLTIIESELLPLCADLEATINEHVLKELVHLSMTMTQPLKLLASMREQEPFHYHLMSMGLSVKNRPPPALLITSTNYLALRGQLAMELPTYLSLLHRGLKVSIHKLSTIQAEFHAKVRDKWVCLWEMLRLEEEMNMSGKETVNVWFARWCGVNKTSASISILRDRGSDTRSQERKQEKEKELEESEIYAEYFICRPLQPFTQSIERRVGDKGADPRCEHGNDKDREDSSKKIATAQTQTANVMSKLGALEPLGFTNAGGFAAPPPPFSSSPRPGDTSSGVSANGLRGDLPNGDQHFLGKDHVERRRSAQSTYPSKSWGDKREHEKIPSPRKRLGPIKPIISFFVSNKDSSTTIAQSTPDYTHTPSSRDPWALKPSKYTCQVIHSCKPPMTGSVPLSYFSFPFFTLNRGEHYDVLQEAGHPSLHPNLPIIVEGEDCLLLCRAWDGSVGWAFASFLEPVDGDGSSDG